MHQHYFEWDRYNIRHQHHFTNRAAESAEESTVQGVLTKYRRGCSVQVTGQRYFA